MTPKALLAAVVVGAFAAVPAQASTLDRVRRSGALHCGASRHASFAEQDAEGRITGVAVDLCRALTIAVLGPQGEAAFRLYATTDDFEGIRRGDDDVVFVTSDDVAEHDLAPSLVPGPVVFVASLTVLMRPDAPNLAGRTVCFMSGSLAHQAVEAWAARTGITIVRSGYEEVGELHDAFDARRCDAIAGEAGELAIFRGESHALVEARLLPPLAVVPVFAAMQVTDGAWAALVSWVLSAVVQSGAGSSPWRSDSAAAHLPALHPGWQADVAAAVGTYADMVRRAAPDDRSPTLNALWPNGLLLPTGPQ